MIQTRKEEVSITGFKPFVVSQENWDIAMSVKMIEQEIVKLPALDNAAHDIFRQYIYPKLSASVIEGECPSEEEAFLMCDNAEGRSEIDKWYGKVKKLNPNWLPAKTIADAPVKDVIFGDGSTLTILGACWLTGLRVAYYEDEAVKIPALEDVKQQLFRISFYPKLIAPVVGGSIVVPTEEEARAMPSDEIDKWYGVVNELQPKWFIEREKGLQEERVSQVEQKKKKEETTQEIMTWLEKFLVDKGDDLPEFFEISQEEFYEFRDNWTLWRALGQKENGGWEAPESFLGVQRMPRPMINTFLLLDSYYGKMLRVILKKKAAQAAEEAKNKDAA